MQRISERQAKRAEHREPTLLHRDGGERRTHYVACGEDPVHARPIVTVHDDASATIELNAPGGVADYCARYAGFYRRLAADPPAPYVWDSEHADRVVAMLGDPPAPPERERKMNERDRRLLALARHKRDHSKS